MRDYAKVSSAFWTGKTGRAIRGDLDAQIVAMYLITSPHATMIGVFRCPIVYIAHETGCPLEGALKGLRRLESLGFCTYDSESELVWVHEMARCQIGDALKPADKRIQGVQKYYECIPDGPIKTGFFAKYALPFKLVEDRPPVIKTESPSEAPSKPLRSQEQEQEQEQEIKPPLPPKGGTLVESSTLVLDGLSEQTAQEFLAHRKRKRAPLTPRAWSGIKGEAVKAGWSLEDAIVKTMARGWQSFDATFVAREPAPGRAGVAL